MGAFQSVMPKVAIFSCLSSNLVWHMSVSVFCSWIKSKLLYGGNLLVVFQRLVSALQAFERILKLYRYIRRLESEIYLLIIFSANFWIHQNEIIEVYLKMEMWIQYINNVICPVNNYVVMLKILLLQYAIKCLDQVKYVMNYSISRSALNSKNR